MRASPAKRPLILSLVVKKQFQRVANQQADLLSGVWNQLKI
jgi:hypothetical protein